MKQVKYLLLAATILAPMAVWAESVEGALKQYDRGKQLILRIKGETKSFLITPKTKFFDMTGREFPDMADPKDTIWKLSSTVTVSFHMKGSKRIVDGVTFPYGRVPPELISKNKSGAPIEPPDGNIEPIGEAPKLSIKVGDRLPEFSIASFSGQKLTNASFSGKVIVLDFWATWCGPCKMLTPVMQKLHDQFKSSGVVVVGANCLEEGANGLAKDYAKKSGYTFPFAFADSLAQKLLVFAIPVVVIVDGNGVVRHIQTGYEEGCQQKLATLIESLLERR